MSASSSDVGEYETDVKAPSLEAGSDVNPKKRVTHGKGKKRKRIEQAGSDLNPKKMKPKLDHHL
jgi:hypothetical protein